jgi:ABC-type branched-subunit amino acid transport system ATPase component
MSDPLLVVRDLHAWYGESHILHGVDFDVRPGEVVTLLGRNGAGKTTTLKSIMGIVRRRSGSVRFDGAELIAQASNAIARRGLAFCPEERGIFASLTVEENLRLPPRVRAGGLSEDAIFGLFPNLRERLRSPGTKLSGGEQQMLAIGRILRTGARLLLLDGHRAADRAHDRAPQGRGLHHPARRAELSLRGHRGRSALRHGARPGGGSRTERRPGRQHGQAARVPRGIVIAASIHDCSQGVRA